MSLLLKNSRLRHQEGFWDIYCEGKSIREGRVLVKNGRSTACF